MNAGAVDVDNAIDRVKQSYGALHAAEKVQFLSSLILVSGVIGFVLLFSSVMGLVSSMTTELAVARGAQTSVEALSIVEFKTMKPAVGTRVRLSDADLAISREDVQRAQQTGYVRVLATPIRHDVTNASGGDVRVVYWEAPSELIVSTWYLQNTTPSLFEEPQAPKAVRLDGVVTSVEDEVIHVLDISRIPTVFTVFIFAVLWAAGLLGGICLLVWAVRLRRARYLLSESVQRSRPISAIQQAC